MHLVLDVSQKDYEIHIPLMATENHASFSISLDDSGWDGANIKLVGFEDSVTEAPISLREIHALINSLEAVCSIIKDRMEDAE